MCGISDIMHKDEQYARGVLRLEKLGWYEQLALGQYALDIQKLRHKHEESCQCGRPREEDAV